MNIFFPGFERDISELNHSSLDWYSGNFSSSYSTYENSIIGIPSRAPSNDFN